MEKNNIIISSGTSLTKLLTVAFVVLKLLNLIDWSWWWVLSPVWISIGLTIIIIGILFLIAWIADIIYDLRYR
jgi:membrane protein YdbS with pleckstrin-like domain